MSITECLEYEIELEAIKTCLLFLEIELPTKEGGPGAYDTIVNNTAVIAMRGDIPKEMLTSKIASLQQELARDLVRELSEKRR